MRILVPAVAVLASVLIGFRACPDPPRQWIGLPGLDHPVRVFTDERGVPHVFAENDLDLYRVQGYLHARDRFFQMDLSRRAASGTLAELSFLVALRFDDVQARRFGLRLAAERAADLLTSRERAIGEAYADGVNAYLAANPLPREYAQLEISSVPPWSLIDSLSIEVRLWAALAGVLAQSPSPISRTALLQSYVDVLGEEAGMALLFGDLERLAPMVPNATVPDASGTTPFVTAAGPTLDARHLASASSAARRYLERLGKWPLPSEPLDRREARLGSNIWGVAASKSTSGRPVVANDSHLELTAPSFYYENHLVVRHDPVGGPMNVTGRGVAGYPGVGEGQNAHVAWGGTSLFTDRFDIFQDRLIRDDPGCPVRLCIASAGELHPVEERSETLRINQVGDGVLDNLLETPPVDVLSVPFRSFGPILDVEDPTVVDGGPATETTVLTLQYAGLHGSRNLRAQLNRQRAQDVFEFREDARNRPNTNLVVADSSGNLAYFASGEAPLRADLEAGTLAGAHPAFIRDGSGPNNWIPDPERSQGQVMPFRVIPFDEMPHVVNPPAGFVVNANEDPSGSLLDNDALNQFRPSNPEAIYYLGSFWINLPPGLRNGRVTRLLREKIDSGEKISLEDMRRFQANTQQLEAELMTPFLLSAFEKAQNPGTPPELVALASDPAIVEAVARLAAWDFSTPTGIPEGYDASDAGGVRNPDVSPTEAAHSVAATLYNVWRGQLLENQVDTPLAALGLVPVSNRYSAVLVHHLLSQEPFTGLGASGVSFFPEPAVLAAEDRRDLALLQALRDALNLLAGDAFATAFGNSTNQDEYRWGRLNRLTLHHPLGDAFSIPPAAGFTDLAPNLPGISRDGGYETVNITILDPFADGASGGNSFRFIAGAASRLVMAPGPPSAAGDGGLGFNSLPGGSSGDPENPLYASHLEEWLTGDYHRMPMSEEEVRSEDHTVQLFGPPDASCIDGIDNDGDGYIDFSGGDPGCDYAYDVSEHSDDLPCDNGVDDDDDGFADLGDPGCAVPHGAREDPECDDGLDNDDDGFTDFDDPNCTAIWPYWESVRCGLGFELALLMLPLMWLYRRRSRNRATTALGIAGLDARRRGRRWPR